MSPRRPKIPELMGRTEAALELGVAPENLRYLRGLPAPVITYLARGDLWLASDIRQLAEERKARRT